MAMLALNPGLCGPSAPVPRMPLFLRLFLDSSHRGLSAVGLLLPNPGNGRAATVTLCGSLGPAMLRENQAVEEEGARWPHRSSKPAWQLLRLPEGSTPSPLRQ